jgi:hypothetical protein
MVQDRAASEPRGGTALAVALTVLAGVIRLVPHPWNFTPVGALGLYGGARLRWWQALTLPLLVMAVTDLILWQTKGWPFNPAVYACFLVNVLIGFLLKRTESPWRIAGCTLAGSVLFFLVTNFSVWSTSRVDPASIPGGGWYVLQAEGSPYPSPMVKYADDTRGLLACYWMGLNFDATAAPPLGFTGNLLAGDLFFSGLLFGAHAWLARRLGRPTPAAVGEAS